MNIRLPPAFYRAAYPFYRLYLRAFGSSIVEVRCLVVHDGRVLLVRHTYGKRAWVMPGGGAGKSEPPEAAVTREVREEVGITIENLKPLPELDELMRGTSIKARFFAAVVPSPRMTVSSGEVAEARWFTPGRLPADASTDVRRAVGLYLRGDKC
jgi:8-oxo-dGTP pyrophosphatase MutT (NUDIX family)